MVEDILVRCGALSRRWCGWSECVGAGEARGILYTSVAEAIPEPNLCTDKIHQLYYVQGSTKKTFWMIWHESIPYHVTDSRYNAFLPSR